MEVKVYEPTCSLSNCSRPGTHHLTWLDGSELYLCAEHFIELEDWFLSQVDSLEK